MGILLWGLRYGDGRGCMVMGIRDIGRRVGGYGDGTMEIWKRDKGWEWSVWGKWGWKWGVTG